jgi:hypothetical protein
MLGREGCRVWGPLRTARACLLVLGLWLAVGAAALSAKAIAAVPPPLTSFPEDTVGGSAAGQLGVPRAIATDPANGHVYVAESLNSRVSEFDAWGEFAKGLGWNVAPGGVNEVQQIRLRATSGKFQLSFGASTTPELPFDATANEVGTALDGLASISAGGGAVSVSGGPGGTPGTTPSVYTVAFDQGPLREADVAQLVAQNGTSPLSGGKPSTLLEARTLASGHAPTTGLEACTSESGCQTGAPGVGAGQMQNPNGLAVDASGDVYVLERSNARVQKFNSAGEFLLMFGGEVNKTTAGNVCTKAQLEGGDVCGVGVKGTAAGFFEPPANFAGDYIAVGADGTVYVGDKERIQEFEAGGAFKGQVKFAELHAENTGFPTEGNVGLLALDQKSGDLYFTIYEEPTSLTPAIFKVDAATGNAVGILHAEALGEKGRLEALETDPAGDLFAAFDSGPHGFPEFEPHVMEWGPSGEVLIDFEAEFASPTPSNTPPSFLALGTNGAGNVYVAETRPFALPATNSVSAYGPAPLTYAPPPRVPPVISEQFATSVGTTSATMRAKINPRFWADTHYYVEYGPASCSASSCATQPTPPGSQLTSQIVNAPLTTNGVLLSGLSPSTTYHYRFVAASSGGGPVTGLSGKTGEAAEGTFTTAPAPTAPPPCPANEAFRPGSGAFLPDCRAYEMVSPVDKNGADVSVVFTSVGDPAQLNQATGSGEELSYSAYRAFGQVQSSPYTSQYVAARGPSGWSTRQISPPREGPSLVDAAGLASQYQGYTEDLCQGWLIQDTNLSLAEGSVENWPNLYRQNICGEGYDVLAPRKAPTLAEVDEFHQELQGFSADGSRAFFIANGKLTGNAQAAHYQLYEARDGQPLRLVCILPGGEALAGGCSAGTQGEQEFKPARHPGRGAWVPHAISAEGTVVYWTASDNGPTGNLYVRINGTKTVAVSSGPAQFWWAAADGSRALYSEGAVLREFVLATGTSHEVASGFKGLMGGSEDGSRAYFVSTENLAAGATAGQPNLYLYEAGTPGAFTFVATLTTSDIQGETYPVSPVPVQHTSRVSPDGGAVAFMSAGSLTGAENADTESGQPDRQVYVYRAATGKLVCASCNVTGARPVGHKLAGGWTSGQIPTAESQLHFSRVLSGDGTRLFFESFDALSLRDTNGKQDVYEWEAVGSGNCSTSAPGYDASYEGCVNLISSGESPRDSEIVDASADGRDVFFKTESSLRPEDPGLLDVYDARAGGGFPLPAAPEPPCQGEACQHPTPGPSDATPSSQSYVGPGNRLQCPKGQHRVSKNGTQRCQKNRRRRHKKKPTAKHRGTHKHGRNGR